MDWLVKIYALPHEGLHLLALLLIGRRANSAALRHVEIPADLTKGQFIFVAAFPSVIFLVVAAFGITIAFLGESALQIVIGAALALAGLAGVAGGAGDWALIAERLHRDQ